MRVLTDDPEWAERLLEGVSWTRRQADGLTGGAGDLRERLFPSGETRLGEAEDPADRFWSLLVLVREAPDSQFDALQGLLRSGWSPSGPVACLARTGRNFHGHRGRRWEIREGNLHMSTAWACGLPARGLGAAFNMLPAVAAVDAIRRASGGDVVPGIKWVNDILDAGRKIGGVLAATQTRGDHVESTVLGIGLNVSSSPDIPPTSFVPGVACLQDIPGGEKVDLRGMLFHLLKCLADRRRSLESDGPGPLLESYRARSVVVGRRVGIWEETTGDAEDTGTRAPMAEGVVEDIGPDLSLRLEGRDEPVAKGRLAFLRNVRDRGP